MKGGARVWLESEQGGRLEGANGRVLRMTLREALQWVSSQKRCVRDYQVDAFTVEQVEASGFTFDTRYVAGFTNASSAGSRP